MISIKRILYLFAIAALLAMSPGGGADQANFPDIYIDGTSAGDGSLASPYSDFASINWTTGGDNSVYDAVVADKDVTINLKRGVTWREQMTVGASGSAAHPITIQAYGEGADPIINGADVVSTWTAATVLGEEMLNNGEFDVNADNWTPSNSSILTGGTANPHSGAGCLTITEDGGTGPTAYQNNSNIVVGKTYRFSMWVKKGTKDRFDFRIYDQAWGVLDELSNEEAFATWNEHYFTIEIPGGTTSVYFLLVNNSLNGDGFNMYFDLASLKETIPNIWQATCTTEPKVVAFNGILGAKQASAAACTSARNWYWNANVLYVYSTGDPDDDYTEPGIEASIRNYGITAIDHDYITVQDIRIDKTNSHGMYVTTSAGDVTNWTVTNINVRNVAEAGIYFDSSSHNCNSIALTSNIVYYWNREGSDDNRAIYFSGSGGTSNTIISNTIEGDIGYGSDTNENNNGIELNGSTSPVIKSNDLTGCDHGIVVRAGVAGWNIQYNYVHQTGDDSIFIDSTSSTGVVAYNVLVDSSNNSIDINNGTNGDAGVFYNNTMYDSGSHTGGLICGGLTSGRHGIFKNNILVTTGTHYFYINHDATMNACTFDNNYYYGHTADQFALHADGWGSRITTFAQWQTDYTADANGKNSDPLMTNPGSDDFTLQVGSPCINRGTFVGLLLDYLGLPVPIGHRPDIGAYEHKNGGAVIH